MRALIELPLNSNVDLKSVYSVIEAINNQYTRTDEALTALKKSLDHKPNQMVNLVHHRLMTKNGLQHTTYQRYLTLYQEALLKQGIDLSSPVIPYSTN